MSCKTCGHYQLYLMVASGQPYGYSGDIPCLLCSRLQRYTDEHTNPNIGLRTPDTVPPVELKDKFNPQSMDAVVWAKEFCRINHNIVDEDTMRGWFANTIMAGYDEARRKYEPKGKILAGGEEKKVDLPMPEELTFEPNKCYTDWQEGTASKINELIRNIRYIREGR
jgi:hypothetical protein